MPTKVFTSATITPIISSGTGANIAAAAASVLAFDADTSWTQSVASDVDNFGNPNAISLSVAIQVTGTLIDDATIPADATLTNINISYDYVVEVGAGVPLPNGAGFVVGGGNDPGGGVAGAGSSSGTSASDNDPLTYLGGVTRADLFTANAFFWIYIGTWGQWAELTPPGTTPVPFVAHTRRVAVSDYTVTVTYVSGAVFVLSISPNVGSVNGGQSVVIHGKGFVTAGATDVLIGGVAVDAFVVLNDTTITTTTPEHASGLVDVEVLGVGVGVDLYTYVVTPSFNLDPLPGRTPIAQGRRG